mmetsp:Transcript_102/g.483  ORF Transcript_102/g.483 Transcript_102/m.483 type:complete len:98 (+) Transcript_102:150-443(+)
MRTTKDRTSKLAARAIGPYQVMRAIGENVYQLRHVGNLSVVTAHRQNLILLRDYTEAPLRRLLGRPHLELRVQQNHLRKHSLLFWRLTFAIQRSSTS